MSSSPRRIFERTGKKYDLPTFGGIPEQLAAATAKMYF
jgi:hypothetical protein